MNKKVLLIDDHAIVLDGIESIISHNTAINVVAKVSDGNMALSYIKINQIDLVITDYSMPDMDGLTLIRKLKKESPNIKILMLSMHDEVGIIREVLAAGLDGYILKKYAQKELLQAIEVVLSGGQYWSREVSSALLSSFDQQKNDTLTGREIEVLKLIVNELNSREIAEKLFISERTVETHRKNLMRKINAINTVGLVKYAYANKLV